MRKRYVYLLTIDDHCCGGETYTFIYSNKKLGIEKYKEAISEYLDENMLEEYSEEDKEYLRKQKKEAFDDVEYHYNNDYFSWISDQEDYVTLEKKEIYTE